MDGGCACGQTRYRLRSAPLFVHCCHCRDCQRQTGSAFVVNALIETDRVEILGLGCRQTADNRMKPRVVRVAGPRSGAITAD